MPSKHPKSAHSKAVGPRSSSPKRCHLVGVAGSGMSALAQLLVARGCEVSGSDRYRDRGNTIPALDKLAAAGVTVTPQDGSAVTDKSVTTVVSSAIEADNPDIMAARKHGGKILTRAEMLARLTKPNKLVAVAGTSGKTTITGMIGWILEQLGADPTVVNGGIIAAWTSDKAVGNVRLGQSKLCVIEADESDRSLLLFKPDFAVISNIGKDHFDIEETTTLFKTFAAAAKKETIGALGTAPYEAVNIKCAFARVRFTCENVPFSVPVPGLHSVQNARLAITVCHRLGHKLQDISRALASFPGIHRRLEVVGRVGGATVIDDFAHNPSKIRAAWESVAPYFKRVLAVWRPHGFGPLAFMQNELSATFTDLCRPVDNLCILPVYFAGGTAKRTVTSWDFVAALRKQGVGAYYAKDYQSCISHVRAQLKAGDAVLVMGARDPDLPALAHALATGTAL